jgi:hypothetical protein
MKSERLRTLKAELDADMKILHVFRNIYQGELDIGKVKLVDSRMPDALGAFKSAHRKFAAALDRLIREVEK